MNTFVGEPDCIICRLMAQLITTLELYLPTIGYPANLANHLTAVWAAFLGDTTSVELSPDHGGGCLLTPALLISIIRPGHNSWLPFAENQNEIYPVLN